MSQENFVPLTEYEKLRRENFKLCTEVSLLRDLWPLNGLEQDTDVKQLIVNHRLWTQKALERAERLEKQRERLSTFFIVNNGYFALEHFPDGDAETGCHVAFIDAGDKLSELVDKSLAHKCGEEEEE